MQSRGKRLWKSWLLLQMLSEISHAALAKRRKWRREYYDSSADHKKTLWMPVLELLAFNISIQAPYFSGMRRRQTRVEWRTWPGVWERQMGWTCTSQSSHPQRAQLSSLHLLWPRWAFPGDTSWIWSLLIPGKPGRKWFSCRTSSTAAHVIPFFTDLLVWEQLLPSHFRFDSMGFSSLHLLMTCLQLLLLLLQWPG